MFPRIYTTTLMAGEKSGNMEEVLGRYIAFQRLALTFKKKLAVSLVYPALLVTMVLVMLVFLVTYVVPEFAKLFENLNAQLPTITVIMLAIGTTGAEVCSLPGHRGRGCGSAVLALEEHGQRSRAHRCDDPEVALDG